MWVVAPTATFVAENDDGDILGLYFIKPNQAGRGAHVCNCGYMVSPKARGQGVATVMCEHSQLEARRIGFTAMQFNFVVATNKTAVALWQRLGFEIIGTLPKVFDHAKLGKVDAHIMFKAFE
jgi:GNAT superfamily N-acetyltransferase